jgi:hypothetical protein
VTVRTLIGCVLVVLALPARSQPEPANAGAPQLEGKAVALYKEALRHYNLAEYDLAIEGFRSAYLITNAPELLYNIAQAYRLQGAGHCTPALQFYRNYLRLAPTSSKRSNVEAVILDMEKCAKAEVPPPAPDAASTSPGVAASAPFLVPAPTEVREPLRHHLPTWVSMTLLGVGVAAAAGGGGTWLWTKENYDALRATGCAPSCDTSRVNRLRTGQTVSLVLMAAGVGVTIGGVALWLTGSGRESVRVEANAAGVRVAARF